MIALIVTVVVLLVLAVVAGVGLVAPRLKRHRLAPPAVDPAKLTGALASDGAAMHPGGAATSITVANREAGDGPTDTADLASIDDAAALPGAGLLGAGLPGAGLPAAVQLDVPEPMAGRMQRLRARLSRSDNSLGRALLSVLSRGKLDDQAWDDVEEALLGADVGVRATTDIVARLRTRTQVLGTASQGELRALLAEELVTALQPGLDRSLKTISDTSEIAVIMVVGVNGTGKTTTCGKLARVLVADGRTVLLAAADTFRAAAAEQLATWGSRVGADTVRGPEAGDPASVAFDAVKRGMELGVDTVLIDTAGRLHTKVGLMDELGKVKRVVEKLSPIAETLLVIDATTGQNGLVQAKVFTEVAQVTGVVLTKLDGTAKGGIVISIQQQLGVPVKLIGLGEGADDLAPFDPEQFVDALLG